MTDEIAAAMTDEFLRAAFATPLSPDVLRPLLAELLRRERLRCTALLLTLAETRSTDAEADVLREGARRIRELE